MIDIRPHKLIAFSDSNGHYDSHGDWVEGSPQVSASMDCRYEDNGAARTIKLEDGSDYRYAYTVYIDNDPDIDYCVGQNVELIDERGKSKGKFSVLGFQRRQLHSILWV